jgi:uncharacterized membrane protein YraQ (UPF0718 family)
MMSTSLFWAIGLRTVQFAIESSGTLLCGLLVAGAMQKMLGPSGTRRLFGGSGWSGLWRAWVAGTILPVCSLGVIPIAREMRRAGVRSATILAFIMAAPHINPLSLLYGLTMSEPFVIISFALGSLAIAFFAGLVWERLLASDADRVKPADDVLPKPGMKRLLAVLLATAREAVGPSMVYVLIGLVTTGVIAALIPHGSLGTTMRHDDHVSPLLMMSVATPMYIGSLPGMMRIGSMFEHGNSVGAAFVLFELGIGMGLGTIAWLITVFGWRRVLLWLGLLAAVTLALAYGAERTLYFAKEEVQHTHAFDDWTNPFIPGATVEWGTVWGKLVQKVEILEPAALGGLACLILAGLLLDKFDPNHLTEARLSRPTVATSSQTKHWDPHVPAWMLWTAACLGLVFFSIVGVYVYYPAPQLALIEISDARTTGEINVRTWNREEALRQIERWDLLTRKLQIAVFIRTGRWDPKQAEICDDLRERLEQLRDLVLADEVKEAKKHLMKVEASYRQFRTVYEGVYGPPD